MRTCGSVASAIRSCPRQSAKIRAAPLRDPVQVADLKGIPIQVERSPVRSGEKFVTPQGFTAIRDGIKRSAGVVPPTPGAKPRWLRAPLAAGARYEALRRTVREHRLSTVCEEAHCPNIGECWNAGTATLLLMGSVCTRACRFCAVDTGNPRGWLDDDERSLLTDSAAELEAKASDELDSLERWVTHAREDREQWETVRVSAVQARLTLQSARTGSFESATGPLADFLRDVGETPQALDIH